jgi:hypothetical protein
MRRRFVVVDAAVGVDEAANARLVELIHRLDAGPRGQRNAAFHPRVGREDDVAVVRIHDVAQARHDVRTLATVLHHHPAVLEIVHLQLARDRARMDAPRRDVRQMRTRRRRVGVIGLVRRGLGSNVEVALIGHLETRKIGGRAIREVPDDDGDNCCAQDEQDGSVAPDGDRDVAAMLNAARTSRRLPFTPRHAALAPRGIVAEACGSRTHLRLV